MVNLVASSRIIMPHFHLPLQSGSDEILSLMKRKYTREVFASRICLIREKIPLAFIGVDVIAGTNGETEEMFRESYDFLNLQEISQLHAFPYSERSGTQALNIPLKVPVHDRKIRTRKYINLSEKKLRFFYEKNLGSIRNVLFEEKTSENSMEGFTENYIRVHHPYIQVNINRPVSMKMVSILPDGHMAGELLK
jgi:threonylcarbamoyladenosine tRNA methylthiotransferase MtaB